MTRMIQALVVGIGNGAIYALLALAFVTIYKSTPSSTSQCPL